MKYNQRELHLYYLSKLIHSDTVNAIFMTL